MADGPFLGRRGAARESHKGKTWEDERMTAVFRAIPGGLSATGERLDRGLRPGTVGSPYRQNVFEVSKHEMMALI